MPEINNTLSYITTIVTLLLGAGGVKIAELLWFGIKQTKQDKKDGWQIAIQTLKQELDTERATAKQYAIETNKKIIELETKIIYLEKRGRLLESVLIKNGMINELEQIEYILDENNSKLDEITKKTQKLPKKQSKSDK